MQKALVCDIINLPPNRGFPWCVVDRNSRCAPPRLHRLFSFYFPTNSSPIALRIASPFVIEEATIKYIDYDLDLRVFPDGSFKVLDRGEYNYHKNKMKYSDDIDKILKDELTNLIDLAREKKSPFQKEIIEKYHLKYEEIIKSKQKV